MKPDSARRGREPIGLSRLPPLTSLRAFVVTARHLSFTQAAAELHVTPAAIGQQIRLLEDHVGAPLFHRQRGRLALTGAGRALTPGLTEGFEVVLETVARVTQARDEDRPIRISAPPSFASKWLVPRLDDLHAFAPGLQLTIDASTRLADFAEEDVDCVVRYGPGAYPGLASELLFTEAVLPVCTPEFAAIHGLDRGPTALAGVPVLHEHGPEQDASCPDWRAWLRSHGLPGRLAQDGIRLSQSSLVLEAAAAGKGIGLGKLRLAAADLAAGRLVSPFGAPWPVEFSYHFLAPPEKLRLPGVARFRDWLRGEAARQEATPVWPAGFERTAAE